MKTLIVFIILIMSYKGYSQEECSGTPQAALNQLLMKQNKLVFDENYNYQDVSLRVEKRTADYGIYDVWYNPRCKGRNPAGYRRKKTYRLRDDYSKKFFLKAGLGVNYYRSNFIAKEYAAKLISRPTPIVNIGGYLIISKKNRLIFNVVYQSYSFNRASNREFEGSDISTVSYRLGLTHHFSKNFNIYGAVGMKEFVLNKAKNLDTLEFYRDISPEVTAGLSYKFYKYQNVSIKADGAGHYYFKGLQGDFKDGYGVSLGTKASYHIKNSKISIGLNVRKNIINGEYYKSDEAENNLTLSFGQKF